MAYTTNQLISGAYYAAGIVSREFETVNGSQISDGLGWLNDILAEKRVDESMIPYETVYTFTASVGQKSYFIPNLIQIDTIVFYLDQVRYALTFTQRNQFFGAARVENIQSLPHEWYFERAKGGGNLHIYFGPDQNYPFEVHGIFDIAPVQLGQDLSASITTADLGVPLQYGRSGAGGVFNPGQFVVNNFDLAGSYFTLGTLVNYINTGVIPGVKAGIVVNDFVLSSTTEPPVPIYIKSNGYGPNGTRFIGNVAAASTSGIAANYSNGTLGIGATLVAPAPAVLTIDGYAVQLNDRVLIKNQTASLQNGSYILTTLGTGSVAWVLTRTSNYDQAIDIGMGDLFTVAGGNVNVGLTFSQNDDVAIMGVSPIEFSVFSAISFANFSTIGNQNYGVFNALGFDQFYITYLRYALADRICAEFNFTTPVNVVRQLSKYEAWISKKSRLIDLQMKKVSSLQRSGGFNWAFINLGKGWVPS